MTATAPGLAAETLIPGGWQPDRTRNGSKKSASSKDIIRVYERRAQKHFPRLLEALPAKPNYAGKWAFRLNKKNLPSFVTWLQNLPPEIEVLLDHELATLRDAPLNADLSLIFRNQQWTGSTSRLFSTSATPL